MRLLLAFSFCLVSAAAFAAPEPPWTVGHDCSGTITSGGTAQVLNISGGAHGFQLMNLSTDAMAFSEIVTNPATFTNKSWTLNPATATTAGGSYSTPSTYMPGNKIYVNAATTGDKFSCVWW